MVGDVVCITSEEEIEDGGARDVVDNDDPLATFDNLDGFSPLKYVGFDKQGTHNSLIYQTPNGTRYWLPQVPWLH
ncbi:hypothetical protein R6Q59_014121 [Mikania micrantha]